VLAIFRNNRFTSAISLALYVLLTRAGALSGYCPNEPDEMGLGGLLYDFVPAWLLENSQYSAIAAAILVFIQALSLNLIADSQRLLPERSWIPGLSYALVSAMLPNFLFLSPPLLAASFVLPALSRFFKLYKVVHATKALFDTGFWLATGTLFYPALLFLILPFWIGINLLRSFSLREQLVFLSGGFVSMFMAWLGYFWYGMGDRFVARQFWEIWGFYHLNTQVIGLYDILKVVVVIAIPLLIGLAAGAYPAKKSIQLQKYISFLYWMIAIGALSIFFQQNLNDAHLLMLAAPAAIFLAMTLTGIKNRIVAEVLHLLLFCGALFLQFFPK
jgi:hypothetical protein